MKKNLVIAYWVCLVCWLLIFLFYPNRDITYIVLLLFTPVLAFVFSLLAKRQKRSLIYLSVILVLISIIISAYTYGSYINV